MKEKTKQTWEEKFDEKFPDGIIEEYDRKTDTWENSVTDKVKAFIKSLILKEREEAVGEVIEEIDGWLKEMPRFHQGKVLGYYVSFKLLNKMISKIKRK